MALTTYHSVEALWTSADGSALPVTEMTGKHIWNTELMLQRKIDRLMDHAMAAASFIGSETVEALANQAMNEIGEEAGRCRAWIEIFRAERARRRRKQQEKNHV